MKILLTGSSSGIGRALAERLVQHGHEVWGLARSAQESIGPKFHAIRCDVGEWAQVERACAEVHAQTASLDAVIACAGVQGEIGPALSADPLGWSATVRANLDGTFYTLRASQPLLARTARRAKVVCFSGGGATKSRLNFSAYGVAKTGVVRLVETIAEEMRGQPYDINAIAPGAINTRLTDEVIAKGPAIVGAAEYAAALKQKQTGGSSLARALDLVEYLLSEQSDGITGRLLSAPWDPWETLHTKAVELAASDIYTLRRIVPEERGKKF
ncbi:MAG: SDR family oxidoreductase [Opitutae bacterium]|nr:SDR family oxidoreductase [Opitutae bacterium]